MHRGCWREALRCVNAFALLCAAGVAVLSVAEGYAEDSWVSQMWVLPEFCQGVKGKQPACEKLSEGLSLWDRAIWRPLDARVWVQQHDATKFRADHWEIDTTSGKMVFSGHARLQTGAHCLQANKMWLQLKEDKSVDSACLQSDVRWQMGMFRLGAHTVHLDPSAEWHGCGVLFKVEHDKPPLRGVAGQVAIQNNKAHFRDAVVTTCPIDDPIWSLAAQEISFTDGWLQAKHAQLYWYENKSLGFSQVSVPYQSGSGWLMPRIMSVGDARLGVLMGYRTQLAQGHAFDIVPYLTLYPAVGLRLEHTMDKNDKESSSLLSITQKRGQNLAAGGVSKGVLKNAHSQFQWRGMWASDGRYPLFLRGVIEDLLWHPYASLPSQWTFTTDTGFGELQLGSLRYQHFKARPTSDFMASNNVLQVSFKLSEMRYFELETALSWYTRPGDPSWDFQQEMRGFGYFGSHLVREGAPFRLHVGVWGQTRDRSSYRFGHVVVAPNVELEVPYLISDTMLAHFRYAYTNASYQDALTVHAWPEITWPYVFSPGRLQALESRILDRNWVQWSLEKQVGQGSWTWYAAHYVSLSKPSVTLTDAGLENPFYTNPLGVTRFGVKREWLDLAGVVLWPDFRLFEVSMDMKTPRGIRLFYNRQQGFPVVREGGALTTAAQSVWKVHLPFRADGLGLSLHAMARFGVAHYYQWALGWRDERRCLHRSVELGAEMWKEEGRMRWVPKIVARMDFPGLSLKSRH